LPVQTNPRSNRTLPAPAALALAWLKNRLVSLQDRLAADITVRDLDDVLSGEKATVKNAWMRYLRAVFNYGVKRDHLSSNPVGKLDFEEVVNGDIEIFDPAGCGC